MLIKDVEDLVKSANILLDKAKASKKDIDQIELEKTAFYKFQKYVVGGELLARKKINGTSDKVEIEKASAELEKWKFIKGELQTFIECEMQDNRDRINLH